MKDSMLPPVRVDAQLRSAAEGVLGEGETLSTFIEGSVRIAVEYRQARAEFLARGQAAFDEYRRTGQSVSSEEVVAKLQSRLDARRKQLRR